MSTSGGSWLDGANKSPTEAGHIDAMCDRFETAWQADRRPRIEDGLAELPAASRPALLCELLVLELAYRRRAGERPEPAEYHARFPGQGGVIDAAFAPLPDPAAARGEGGAETEADPTATSKVENPTPEVPDMALDPPAVASERTGTFLPEGTPPGSVIGTVIAGRDKLRQQIGEGRMGSVYLSRRPTRSWDRSSRTSTRLRDSRQARPGPPTLA